MDPSGELHGAPGTLVFNKWKLVDGFDGEHPGWIGAIQSPTAQYITYFQYFINNTVYLMLLWHSELT